MIKKIVVKITCILLKKEIISKEDFEMYNYCVELAIVSLISYLFLLFIAIIFDEIICALLFLVFFSFFRRLNGGYHANNYTKCAIISLSCYIFMLLIIKNFKSIFAVSYLLFLIGLILIILISPQQDDNKPLTKRQYHLLKTVSKNITAILIMVLVLVREWSETSMLFQNKFIFSIAYATDLVAISLLISKLERRIKNEKLKKHLN